MLRRLTVENYALIERLDMELDAHLNIITGETGAGKSILLGALGLLMGNKNESGSIRGLRGLRSGFCCFGIGSLFVSFRGLIRIGCRKNLICIHNEPSLVKVSDRENAVRLLRSLCCFPGFHFTAEENPPILILYIGGCFLELNP